MKFTHLNRLIWGAGIVLFGVGMSDAKACGYTPDPSHKVLQIPQTPFSTLKQDSSSAQHERSSVFSFDENSPLSCRKGPYFQKKYLGVYLYNQAAQSFLAGQAPVPGWSGGWREDSVAECEEHIAAQQVAFEKYGINFKRSPILCANTQPQSFGCFSSHIYVIAKSNQPLIDPTASAAIGDGRPSLENYDVCAQNVKKLLNQENICVPVITGSRNEGLYLLIGFDALTESVKYYDEVGNLVSHATVIYGEEECNSVVKKIRTK